MITRLILILLIWVSAASADFIPADALYPWGTNNTGIPGGIRARTNIYVTLGTNATSADIHIALANCPAEQVVQLVEGDYYLTNTITITGRRGNTLRGAGMNKTRLNVTHFNNAFQASGSSFSPAYGIVGSYAAHSTNLTLVQPGGNAVLVGKRIFLTQNIPAAIGGNGTMSSYHVITAVQDSTHITVTPPIGWAIDESTSAANYRIEYYTSTPQYVGLESFSVIAPTNSAYATQLIIATWAFSWLKDIELRHFGKEAIYFSGGCRNEIRGCYPNRTQSVDDGYGIQFFSWETCSLVEDNVFNDMWVAIMVYKAMGCAFINNYATNTYTKKAGWENKMQTSYSSGHGPVSSFCLWEGNVGNGLADDGYYGVSARQTLFRNWFHGDPVRNEWRRIVDFAKYNYYHSVVGNVLGSPLWTPTSYDMQELGSVDYALVQTIYRLGFPAGGNNGLNYTLFPVWGYDTNVMGTIWRNGNYDYRNMATVWTNGAQNLPSSLFYPSRPASWPADLPWPAYGPDLNPMVKKNPAQVRWETDTVFVGGGTYPGPIPDPPDPPDPPPQDPPQSKIGLRGKLGLKSKIGIH